MRGTDLTAVIAWLEAGCDPAEAVKELRSHQDALTSQSLSLSEAREEIERLKGLVAASEAQRYRVCGELLARVEAAEQALKPFALTAEHDIGSTETDADIFQQMGQYNRAPKITVGDMRRALAALENGPAGLADANTNPADSDLSSLRKGAEVVGEAAAYDFVAGWHERQAKLFREMADDDPRTAEPQRKRAFEAAIHHAASAAALRNRAADDRRAALVSGSREEG